MKDKVKELSYWDVKAFAISAGDKEGFFEGSTSVGYRTAADLLEFISQ